MREKILLIPIYATTCPLWFKTSHKEISHDFVPWSEKPTLIDHLPFLFLATFTLEEQFSGTRLFFFFPVPSLLKSFLYLIPAPPRSKTNSPWSFRPQTIRHSWVKSDLLNFIAITSSSIYQSSYCLSLSLSLSIYIYIYTHTHT